MKKIIGFLVGGSILILMVIASIKLSGRPQDTQTTEKTGDFSYARIMELVDAADFNGYDPEAIIPATEDSGNLPEKIKGNKDAKVIIYEYADYACSHCASANAVLNKIISDYHGQVALVFRNYVLNGFPNNIEVASAVNAAAIQGYWDAYKDAVFENQSTWYTIKSTEIVDYLGDLFAEVSNGQGDLSQFYADMASESVAKRIAFDYGLGQKVDLSGTPHFRINGEAIKVSELRDKIDELLR